MIVFSSFFFSLIFYIFQLPARDCNPEKRDQAAFEGLRDSALACGTKSSIHAKSSQINELIDSLQPFKLGVELLCRRDSTPITSYTTFRFILEKLKNQETVLSAELSEAQGCAVVRGRGVQGSECVGLGFREDSGLHRSSQFINKIKLIKLHNVCQFFYHNKGLKYQ